MIQIRGLFEDTHINFLRDEFLADFNTNLKNTNQIPDYFGMTMIIKKEYVAPLLDTIQKYLLIIVGIKINDLNVVPYVNADELPQLHSVHIKMNKCSGMETNGFYYPKDKTVYVAVGKHLKKLLPTMFHELTHAYLHQNDIKLIDNYEKPKTLTFDFISMMHEADQEEGVCELVASLLCYHIFDNNKTPSNVDSYWLGWRLSTQAFVECAKVLIKMCPEKDAVFITKTAFYTVINTIKQSNNLYKFAKSVPPDSYSRTKEIQTELQ